MKTLFTIYFLAFLYQLASAQSPLELFSKKILEAIQEEDFSQLNTLLPKADVYRVISPEETYDKNDNEIITLSVNHHDRLEEEFENVLLNAKSKYIALERLNFYEVEHELLPIMPLIFFSVHIHYEYKPLGKGILSLNTVNYDEAWYLLKIINHKEAFEEIED